MTSVWILFGVREVSGSTIPHPYFIGAFNSRDDANAARVVAVSNSKEEHPQSLYYVKEASIGVSYPYEWSTMDD
jgi:hypothetical protein